VTETHATAGAGPTFPPGRYGRRREARPRRRWLVATVATIAVLAALAVSVRLFQQYGQPEFAPQVRRFFDITDTGITVEFEVHKPADKMGTCSVRARSANGDEVGLAQVDAPVGAQVVVTYRLAPSGRPVVVEVPRCTARS
jgi:hypothetical protein